MTSQSLKQYSLHKNTTMITTNLTSYFQTVTSTIFTFNCYMYTHTCTYTGFHTGFVVEGGSI